MAIQDAIATARLLGLGLKTGRPLDLAQVQQRRHFPTAVTQRMQLFAQSRFVDPMLHAEGPVNSPFPLRMLRRFPPLQGLPARLIGLGARPEDLQ